MTTVREQVQHILAPARSYVAVLQGLIDDDALPRSLCVLEGSTAADGALSSSSDEFSWNALWPLLRFVLLTENTSEDTFVSNYATMEEASDAAAKTLSVCLLDLELNQVLYPRTTVHWELE